MRDIRLLLFLALVCKLQSTSGQSFFDTSIFNEITTLPDKYYSQQFQKIEELGQKFEKKAESYLQKVSRHEQNLFRKVWKRDSTKAKEIFGDVDGLYLDIQEKTAAQAKKLSRYSQVYSGKLDSLSTAFKFLKTTSVLNNENISKLNIGLTSIDGLRDKLNQAELIKKFLKERKKILTEQLSKLGLVNELKRLNKTIFYYQQQVNDYKQILEDPTKLGDKLLELLVDMPAFRKYFSENSQLASLFRLPGSSSNSIPNAMAGLQTRATIQQDINSRLGYGTNVQRMIQENTSGAQNPLTQLKDQLNQHLPRSGGTDEDLPDFKPNSQKTKSLLQRLELGTNFQTQGAFTIFPAATDFGLSIGYKLNDKSIIGIGASYRVGWGSGWNDIDITHQGLGLRSFVDLKLRGSLFISGGYEQNFRTEIKNFDQLKDQSAWQQSGLIGLGKSVSMKSKFFKKSKVQILWDFLSYGNIPRSQPILFRFGYTF